MPPPSDSYDAPPVRPGWAETFDPAASGVAFTPGTAPVWERMTKALVGGIRSHFSLAARIEHPNLYTRVWAATPDSPIVITSLAEWNPAQTAERPAVLVDRLNQDLDLAHRAVGSQYHGVRPGRFSRFMTGQHVVHCVGGAEGEAEVLAWEVWRFLTRFESVFRNHLCLLRFLPTQVGKRVQLDEHKKTYSTPVAVAYGYEEAWRTFNASEEEVTAVVSSFGFGG